jgi:hypothetical protein
MRAQLCSNRSTNLPDIGTSRHHGSCRGYEILEYPLLRTAEPLAASLAQTPYLRLHRQRPHNALSSLPCTQRMTADDQKGCRWNDLYSCGGKQIRRYVSLSSLFARAAAIRSQSRSCVCLSCLRLKKGNWPLAFIGKMPDTRGERESQPSRR